MVWELIEEKMKEGELVVIFIFKGKKGASSHQNTQMKKKTSFQRTDNLEKVRRACKVLKSFCVSDIIATTSLPPTTVRDNLAKLIKAGEVKLVRKDGRRKVWMWVGKEVVKR